MNVLDRHIIHFHIPAFSIAVARACQPELKGRPVVVAPPQSERALILSVSPEARKEGIFKGMPLVKAKRWCPDLTVLPPNPERMKRACQTLGEVVARYTPLWEPSRPGHIYLDVTGTGRLWGKAKDTARFLREEIKIRLSLMGSAGVAGNKLVSGIASRVMPGEGVLDVDHGQEAPFMAPLKVNLLPGIGRFRRKILLEELNITLVRELAVLDLGRLKLIFGRQAYLVHQRALGIDPTPVFPPHMKPMVTEEVTLPQDENDDQKLLAVLYTLVEKCAQRLRKRALRPRQAGLLIRYSDQMESKRQLRLPRRSFWDFDLYSPLESLFLKACSRRVRVRFMKIWFWDFSPSNGQLSLFHDPAPDAKKKSLVIQALDRIRQRHGKDAIGYGRTVHFQEP
jgi:DNA polymerase-4